MTKRDAALAFFVVSVWGFGFTLAKPAVGHFPPIFLTLLAFVITGVVLTILERRKASTSHGRAALIALFAISLQAALIFTGLVGLDASTAVLAAQAQVPMAVLWAWAFRSESFNWRTLSALVIALAGVAVIAGLPETPPAIIPLMTLLAGGLAWGLGQVLTARLGADEGVVLLRQVTYHAIPQLALASLLFETGQVQSVMTASLPIWAAAAFIAVGSYTICYIIWFSLLMRNPVSSVTPFVFFMAGDIGDRFGADPGRETGAIHPSRGSTYPGWSGACGRPYSVWPSSESEPGSLISAAVRKLMTI